MSRRRTERSEVRDTNRIIVKNIPSKTTWQDLKDFMRKAGRVTFADILKDRDGEGVVEFARRDDMKYALRELDNEKLNGSRVTLEEAGRSRRRSSRDRSRSPRRSRSRRDRSRTPESRSRSRSRSPARRDRGRSHSRSPSRSHSRTRSPTPSRSRSASRRRSDERDDEDKLHDVKPEKLETIEDASYVKQEDFPMRSRSRSRSSVDDKE
ncbi:Serine-arginine protein 55 [Choanephora cucurbitarum]|uniref:Serine-arginine protein 55 n=1 Tax=Choanephora cucurbitarum TaxID=101091 RepID=A0A1C7MWY3_9FUNG|nr:Serine-arginine protein 55 [Choanephora cucurbitarum]